MAAPAVAAAKAAFAVVTDPKLRRIAGGIILGIIIVIIMPIAMLLGFGSASSKIDWGSLKMQQYLIDHMSSEEKAQLRRFENMLSTIENEIILQGLDIEPIKAQVIFLCLMINYEQTDTLYSDFVSCFADGADDKAVF